MSELPEYLTVEEAAALLRIGRTSAYALAREWRETNGQKGLPVLELGRQLRVPRAALERMHATPSTTDEGEVVAPSIRREVRDQGEEHVQRKRRWRS
jgi:excisionase family DNA binding protein